MFCLVYYMSVCVYIIPYWVFDCIYVTVFKAGRKKNSHYKEVDKEEVRYWTELWLYIRSVFDFTCTDKLLILMAKTFTRITDRWQMCWLCLICLWVSVTALFISLSLLTEGKYTECVIWEDPSRISVQLHYKTTALWSTCLTFLLFFRFLKIHDVKSSVFEL